VENPKYLLRKDKFKDKYGTIIESIKIDRWSVFYYPIFLFQRLLYSFLLIFLSLYPFIQIALIIPIFALVLLFISI